MKTLAAFIIVLLVASASAASRVEFGRAMAEADKARESAEGHKYGGALAAAMKDFYSTGIHCVPLPPTRDSYFTIVSTLQLMGASNESLNGRRVRQRDASLRS